MQAAFRHCAQRGSDFGLDLRLLAGRFERRDGGRVKHRAVWRELRAVAGAVPALLGRIPLHDAAQMRAYGGAAMQLAVEIAADRDLALALADDPTLAGTELGSRIQFGRQDVLGQVLDQRDVFAEEFRMPVGVLRDGS